MGLQQVPVAVSRADFLRVRKFERVKSARQLAVVRADGHTLSREAVPALQHDGIGVPGDEGLGSRDVSDDSVRGHPDTSASASGGSRVLSTVPS